MLFPLFWGRSYHVFFCGSKAAVIETMMEKHDISPFNEREGRFEAKISVIKV